MTSSLTDRNDIIANSSSLITSNGSVVDMLDAIEGTIVGLPPSSLNAIEKLSAAISNDPNYFQTMQTSVNAKASQSNTYTKGEVNAFLDGKPDDSELTAAVDSLTSAIGTKQNKFLVAEIPANTGRLFDNNSTKFRAINVGTPLSITATRDDYLSILCGSYTKTEVTDKIPAVVGAAPALLDTLAELSAALNNDSTYAATITSALAAKAPLASPASTGIATAAALTVSGNLINGTTNVLTSLNSKATTADLGLKSLLPALLSLALLVDSVRPLLI